MWEVVLEWGRAFWLSLSRTDSLPIVFRPLSPYLTLAGLGIALSDLDWRRETGLSLCEHRVGSQLPARNLGLTTFHMTIVTFTSRRAGWLELGDDRQKTTKEKQ